MSVLVLLLALAAPEPVNDLSWHVRVPKAVASVGPIGFSANLISVSKEPLRFEAATERPPVTLVLVPRGEKPVRRPLPKGISVYRTRGAIRQHQAAWVVHGDLRLAFGPLGPGHYTLQVVHEARDYKTNRLAFKPREIVSDPVGFEIVKTTLEDARKKAAPTPGFEFKVEKRKQGYVGVFENRTKAAVTIWAYGDHPGRPLSTTAMAEYWTGRGWDREGGGYCGTGLERVTIAAGAKREIELPPNRGGVVRVVISVFEGKKERSIASVPVLIKK